MPANDAACFYKDNPHGTVGSPAASTVPASGTKGTLLLATIADPSFIRIRVTLP